jgi:hypothetical protein
MQRIGFGLVLAVLLTACQLVGPLPSQELVKQALTIELNQTQQQLRQQLRMGEEPVEVAIDRVSISDYAPLAIDDLQAFRVQGTYNFTVKLPKREITRRQNPFEIYLLRQAENKTWRLAKLRTDETGEAVWETQLVPPLDT